MPNPDYQLPDIDLLTTPPRREDETTAEIFRKRDVINRTLHEFDIAGEVVDYTIGPCVTRFEIMLAPGVRVKKVAQITDNLAMNLGGDSIRIIPPKGGRATIGVEVSNTRQTQVYSESILRSRKWDYYRPAYPLLLGETWSREPVIEDLTAAPHLLIGGMTGTGKSVLTHTMIAGLLFSRRPDDLKLLLIDLKIAEFNVYRDLPHLLAPVITDATRAAGALRWTVGEIDCRFKLMGEAGVKNIREYNGALGDDEKKLPRIVVIIDELADLRMSPKTVWEDVESSICRIAQQGRAAGVHLIVSTQRPSTNVITGFIKANFPTRIAFRVLQQADSRVILDLPGAENLLGMGDMLLTRFSDEEPWRIQGAYIPDDDIKRLVAFVNRQAKPEFVPELMKEQDNYFYLPEESNPLPDKAEFAVAASKFIRDGDDDLIRRAVALILLERKGSTSFLQRWLRIGYNRSLEILNELEARELISPMQEDGKRKILVEISQE